MKAKLAWILLLYSLPSKSGALRLSLWRQLKRLGAVSLKTSACVLPDKPELHEALQWLAQGVRQQGGDATLVRTDEIEGITDEEIIGLFQQARTADYEGLLAELKGVTKGRGRAAQVPLEELEKWSERFKSLRQVDYFDCTAATRVEQALMRLGSSGGGGRCKVLKAGDFRKRVWLTRPRPEVDRVGSAWLIRRFIDPEAVFVFAPEAGGHPEALPFDMVGAEFGHHGDDCTFETFLRRFSLGDPGLRALAAIVHDADLADGKHGTREGSGLLAIFRGWAQMGLSDDEILARGFDCFDALYRHSLPRARQPSLR
jgi:hypothetical protein